MKFENKINQKRMNVYMHSMVDINQDKSILIELLTKNGPNNLFIFVGGACKQT